MRYFLLALFTVYSTPLVADVVSEVGVVLSTDKTNLLLEKISGNFLVENQSIELEAGGFFDQIQKTSTEISLDSDLHFSLMSGNKAAAYIKFNEFKIAFNNFVYETITIIKRSGIRAKVKTKIVCTSLPIYLRDWRGSVSTNIHYNGETLVLKDGGDLALYGENIFIDFSKCNAPKGVSSLFEDEIQKWVNSSSGKDILFEQALSFGQDFINTEWKSLKDEELSLDIMGNHVDLDLKKIRFFDDHLYASGLLKLKSDVNMDLTLEESAYDSFKGDSGVILPKSFFVKVVPEFLKKSNLAFELLRAEIPGVDFLFNSRFIQFFVWSDLLNFKKKSNFKAGINLSKANASFKSSRKKGFSYSLDARHDVEMAFLNSKKTEYPYMNFSGRFKGGVDLDLHDSGFSLKIKSPKLSAKSSWHAKMTSWRKSKPKGKPWMRMIIPRVEKAFKGTEFSYSWEDVGVGSFIKKVSMSESAAAVFLNVSLQD